MIITSDNKKELQEKTGNDKTSPVVEELRSNISTDDIIEESFDDVEFDDDYFEEGFFGVGFGTLRSTIKEKLGDAFTVSNVQNPTGKEEKFTIKPHNGTDDVVNVISVGNGVKAYALVKNERISIFNNASLSIAGKKLLEKIDEIFGKFKPVSESFRYITFGNKGFSRWNQNVNDNNDNVIAEADDTATTVENEVTDNTTTEDPVTNDKTDDTDTDDDIDLKNSNGDGEVDDVSSSPNNATELQAFGSDTSSVQNQYDNEEVKMLNELISDENHAVARYFDGAKNTKDPILARLYSDIGAEERFHAEQLLYAKSQKTGEEYTPQDLNVKREYEELVNMGMDEETAMATAFDKANMNSRSVEDELGDIDNQIETLEFSIEQTLAMMDVMDVIQEYGNANVMGSVMAVYESYNLVEYAGTEDKVKLPNPITLLMKLFKWIFTMIHSLAVKLNKVKKDFYMNYKRNIEFIKKYGIKGLFAKGVHLYFYNDTKPNDDIRTLIIQFIYRLDAAIQSICREYKINTPNQFELKIDDLGDIQHPTYNSAKQSITSIQAIRLQKTKVLTTENNSQVVTDAFFGDKNGKLSYTAPDGTLKTTGKNVFEMLNASLSYMNEFNEKCLKVVLEDLENQPSNPDSLSTTNPVKYNECVKYMNQVLSVYTKIINAINSDIDELSNISIPDPKVKQN